MAAGLAKPAGALVLTTAYAGVGGSPQCWERTGVGTLHERRQQPHPNPDRELGIATELGRGDPGVGRDGDVALSRTRSARVTARSWPRASQLGRPSRCRLELDASTPSCPGARSRA
jgi:hypothetical protein